MTPEPTKPTHTPSQPAAAGKTAPATGQETPTATRRVSASRPSAALRRQAEIACKGDAR